MLLMVEEVIRGGKYHAIHQYAKANNKCMKGYDKHGCAMSQKLPANYFKWVEHISEFNESFIKS